MVLVVRIRREVFGVTWCIDLPKANVPNEEVNLINNKITGTPGGSDR